ncbi:tol-pal system protein YbgF [Methylobacter sp. S3L5C]|uniref:tol-pal system protein YbgF n=1 Tax=Methylobacter sp. S3L5C TaxID=2839024 RepID=UPI001FADFED3|nr:tol-pal system protein YbgF [Methylobacter sp. S3L5C]UOA10303.1 tol-pal system protein YbgF [Methylobacter sp. S3L5C]
MKKVSLIMLLSACSSVYAELPPVVDHSLYPASATPAPASANAPSTNALYELMGRLEQMQAEVQRLTGKVDEQAYRIEELKKHQSTMYSDFDERLQGIENKGNGVDQPAAEGTPEAVGAGDTEAKPSDSSAAEPVPATEPVPANKPASASAPAAENQAPQPKSDGVQVSGPEKQEYYQAYDELRNGHTDQSIAQFNSYLSKYPSGLYANNAQYWLGEAYRVKQDNDAARKAFNGVIEKYPNGAKVPDALLKLGYLEIELKNSAKAREYLTRVTTDYPKSPAALLAAKKLLKLNDVKN